LKPPKAMAGSPRRALCPTVPDRNRPATSSARSTSFVKTESRHHRLTGRAGGGHFPPAGPEPAARHGTVGGWVQQAVNGPRGHDQVQASKCTGSAEPLDRGGSPSNRMI
jgi:hypothetical protein